MISNPQAERTTAIERPEFDVKAEYKSFCAWAKNHLPFTEPPSAQSYLFDAWLASARNSRTILQERS